MLGRIFFSLLKSGYKVQGRIPLAECKDVPDVQLLRKCARKPCSDVVIPALLVFVKLFTIPTALSPVLQTRVLVFSFFESFREEDWNRVVDPSGKF